MEWNWSSVRQHVPTKKSFDDCKDFFHYELGEVLMLVGDKSTFPNIQTSNPPNFHVSYHIIIWFKIITLKFTASTLTLIVDPKTYLPLFFQFVSFLHNLTFIIIIFHESLNFKPPNPLVFNPKVCHGKWSYDMILSTRMKEDYV